MTHPSVRERVSPEEWQIRVDLAATSRLVALFGWDDVVFTHVSARIPGPEHHSHQPLRGTCSRRVGTTPAEAFLAMYLFEAACMIQVRAQAGGGELIPIAQPILDGIQKQAKQVMRGAAPGALAWPALLRKLDRVNPGYRD